MGGHHAPHGYSRRLEPHAGSSRRSRDRGRPRPRRPRQVAGMGDCRPAGWASTRGGENAACARVPADRPGDTLMDPSPVLEPDHMQGACHRCPGR